jgi:HEAT repeat protein
MKKVFVIAASMLNMALLSAGPGIAQTTFEQTVADLKNPSADARLHAVQLLKDAGYPEAATPLAEAIADADNDVQLAAIAAELNIFLGGKVSSSRRVGLVVEVRSKGMAGAAFAAGRSAVGPRVVPLLVATALHRATHDESPQVALEAMYAFGTLAPEVSAADRPELLRSAVPDLSTLFGASDSAMRLAALRVVARVYARRSTDAAPDETLGDAVIGALNERNADLRVAAMDALGAIRYERATQALTDLFEFYKRGAPAESALGALAHIASPSSATLFTTQLSASTVVMKTAAVEGLARLGDPSKKADIEKAIESDRNDSVLLAAAFAAATLSKGPIELIVDALAHPKQHEQAFNYLVELAPGRSRAFGQGAQDPDPGVRADVADILGIAGDPAARPMVDAMKQDRDPAVARAVERARTRLGDGR